MVLYKTNVLHFKVENTSLKDTYWKGKFKRMFSFLSVDKRKLFFTKSFFEEFAVHEISSRAIGFEKHPSIEVFKEFPATFYTL